jgi:hypothetical protein
VSEPKAIKKHMASFCMIVHSRAGCIIDDMAASDPRSKKGILTLLLRITGIWENCRYSQTEEWLGTFSWLRRETTIAGRDGSATTIG